MSFNLITNAYSLTDVTVVRYQEYFYKIGMCYTPLERNKEASPEAEWETLGHSSRKLWKKGEGRRVEFEEVTVQPEDNRENAKGWK